MNSGLWVRSEVLVSFVLLERSRLHTDALVTELATNFVDTVKTTNDKLLQVKLRRNTEEELHIQLVVVCLERSCGGTSSNLVHHRCLDFKEVTLVEVLADVLDNLGSGDEGLAGGVVHDEIKETVAVALLLVLVSAELVSTVSRLQPAPHLQVLCGQHPQAGCEEDDLVRENAKLAISSLLGSCPSGVANDTDDIYHKLEQFVAGPDLCIPPR